MTPPLAIIPVDVEKLGLSLRAQNLLQNLRIGLDELAAMPANELWNSRGMGENTIMELAIMLVKRWKTPRWLQHLAVKFQFETISQLEAEAKGYRLMSGPYDIGEQWMLINVIADMERGMGCEYRLAKIDGGIGVYRPSGKMSEPAETETE